MAFEGIAGEGAPSKWNYYGKGEACQLRPPRDCLERMSPKSKPEAAPAAQRAGKRRAETLACVLVALLVGWFYLWSALQPANSWVLWGKNPEGYYPLETAGFRSGHLYAALTPHPALLALPDPYDPVANAPYRVHDMTLYKGHYYLYFGVTPAVVLFWPVAALTGRYLAEPSAVAFFCIGAIWVGMALLLAIRRRHFPGAPTAALLAGWVCLGWATPLLILVEGPQFYQVPISCAIFLQALMLAAIYGALHSASRKLPWMAGAGLAFGLAIGARPNYLACSFVLLVPVVAYALSTGTGRGQRARALFRALSWTLIPALACGIGILAFNYARFGSVAEFGMHYQLGGERFMKLQAISLARLIPHGREYLFNPGNWQSYFPFFSSPAGQPYGFLRYLPWSWLVVAALLRPRRGDPGERPGLWPVVLAILGASVANLAFLSCFFGTTSRYPGDFAHAALILAGIGALALGQRLAILGRTRAFQVGAAALAGVSLAFGLAVFVGAFPRPDVFSGLARAVNWPAYAWESGHGANFGGLHLELGLPEHPPADAEPLFETGIESDRRDWLQITYLPGNRARLDFFHAGTGTFAGREFQIPKDRKITVDARCGSLMPPFTNPVFSSWSRPEFNRAKRDLQITENGTEVLRAALDCYDSSPANLTVGHLAWFTGGMQQVFTGKVLAESRLPLEKPALPSASFATAEPLQVTLMLPAVRPSSVDPLLVTGDGKESDLLYCAYDGLYHVSFGLDHYGSGGPRSEPLPYDPLVPHTLVVWMGSMAGLLSGQAPADAAANSGRLAVIFDGHVAINADQVFYPSRRDPPVIGLNPFGSTVAGTEFTGRVVQISQLHMGALPAVQRSGNFGAVEMTVELPLGAVGTQEPLVVTGVTGAGDMVYIRYVDATHVSLGFDHWGIGGSVGDPVEVDYGANHRISVAFKSLFPPGSAAHASDRVLVQMDGRAVLESHWDCHPSTAEQITVGKNPIGGSTCGPEFTGRILDVERSLSPPP